MIRILPNTEQEALALRRTLASLDGIRFVAAGETDPALMLRLGEADLAVLYGRAASSLLGDGERPLRMARAPGWDRTYFLWSGERRRWVNDPAFRAWLAGVVEREPLLRFLFDGRGAAAHSLSAPGSGPAGPAATHPMSWRQASPRVSLRYDRHDPHARSIAARLKAALETEGVRLTLHERHASELSRELQGPGLELALVVHRVTGRDTDEALGRTLESLGHHGEAGRHLEQRLLTEARLIPLVRLDAWLATPRSLRRVRAGRWGELHLEKARWRR